MTWGPTLTADEFARAYAGRSGLSLADLRSHGRDARPCNCQDEGCDGWMMVNAVQYDEDVRAWEAGHSPHPGRLTKGEWDQWVLATPPSSNDGGSDG